MTASLRELEAEISHKNHMAEDSARTVIVLKQEIKELEVKISSKDHTAEESQQTIVSFQQEIKASNQHMTELEGSEAMLTNAMALKTTELEQAKDELKKAEKELLELSDALCVESASIQKLQREILRKNIILEDCEEKKMRYLTSQASHEQITELKNSETALTITITLKTIELEKATWQFGYAEGELKRAQAELLKFSEALDSKTDTGRGYCQEYLSHNSNATTRH
ncbi:hypothetical protein K438DRAFT_1783264 [Mycena galopus ATCC 62051]|nr:hypothetical protein K438DRAFT_1783264 [Mycena galopus ATCC 62051]